MINEVAINVKIDSILEPDNRLFLKPNNLGLYNASEMFERFAQAKSELAAKINDPLASTTYASFSMAAELFLKNLDQSESLVTINGLYWCNLSYLQLLLKFCSPLYADAVNTLETGAEITVGDWAHCTAKKYSVICFFGDDDECYISTSIWATSRILRDENGIYEFVMCARMKVNDLAQKYNLSPEDQSTLYKIVWRYLSHGTDRYMQYFAQNQAHDYSRFVEIMKESLDALEQKAIELAPQPPVAMPAKKGFLSRLFEKK